MTAILTHLLFNHVEPYSGHPSALLFLGWEGGTKLFWGLTGNSGDCVYVTGRDCLTVWLTSRRGSPSINNFPTSTQFRLSTHVTCFRQSTRVSCFHPRIAVFQFTQLEQNGSVKVNMQHYGQKRNNRIALLSTWNLWNIFNCNRSFLKPFFFARCCFHLRLFWSYSYKQRGKIKHEIFGLVGENSVTKIWSASASI